MVYIIPNKAKKMRIIDELLEMTAKKLKIINLKTKYYFSTGILLPVKTFRMVYDQI